MLCSRANSSQTHHNRRKNLSAARNLLAASNLRLFRAKLRCDIPVNPLQIERINYDYEFRLTRKTLPALRRREREGERVSEIETRVEQALRFLTSSRLITREVIVPAFAPKVTFKASPSSIIKIRGTAN